MNIPLTKPLIDTEDFKAIQAPLKTGWLVQGPYVAQFEEMVAQYCGVQYAVATSSCTSALHLSMLAAGIGPGDEVLVPAFTYVATANAVEHAGARPIFIDIDPVTFNMSVEALQSYLAKCESDGIALPKAIIPVHLFGLCADMTNILRLGQEHSLIVIEDAACALGSNIQGKAPGSFGLTACFSFHPRKVITTGEGGMVVTQDEKIATHLRILRDHGADTSDHSRHLSKQGELPEFNHLGYNYRMNDIQGALGKSQMNKLPRIIKERKRLAESYNSLLEGISWLRMPSSPDGYIHTYQSYVCQLDADSRTASEIGKIRSALMNHLAKQGISTRPGTHAVHQLGYYKKKYSLSVDQYPNAWMAHNNTITLPLYVGMNPAEQEYVVETISNFRNPDLE